MVIDRSFDFRTDVRPSQDPDKYSPALRSYHKALWSKPLPNGKFFELIDNRPDKYLYHSSELGDFSLSSDSITHSYIFTKRMAYIIEQLDEGRKEKILSPLYTIGGFILFPSDKVDNKITINGARGFNARIVDRFDLTLECIRRHYLKLESPLQDVFQRYKVFFDLFDDFKGYVEFFLLQDLVSQNFSEVNFLLPFDDSWPTQPLPKSLKQYNHYITNTIDFVVSRGIRMENTFNSGKSDKK